MGQTLEAELELFELQTVIIFFSITPLNIIIFEASSLQAERLLLVFKDDYPRR